jgi:hypothetical protein
VQACGHSAFGVPNNGFWATLEQILAFQTSVWGLSRQIWATLGQRGDVDEVGTRRHVQIHKVRQVFAPIAARNAKPPFVSAPENIIIGAAHALETLQRLQETAVCVKSLEENLASVM